MLLMTTCYNGDSFSEIYNSFLPTDTTAVTIYPTSTVESIKSTDTATTNDSTYSTSEPSNGTSTAYSTIKTFYSHIIPPIVRILNPETSICKDTEPVTISGIAFDLEGYDIVNVSVSVDGTSLEVTGTKIWSAECFIMNTGTHTIVVKAISSNGLSNVVQKEIVIDDISPSLGIINPENGSDVCNTFILNGTAVDSEAAISSVEYSLDGTSWLAVSVTDSWSANITTLGGTVNLYVRCYDKCGNMSTTHTATYNVSTGAMLMADNTNDGVSSPYRLDSDGTEVFWTNYKGNSIMKATINSSPGSAVTLVGSVDGVSSPYTLTIDTDYVYFVDDGNDKLYKIAKTGGTLLELETSLINDVRALAVDDAYLYWVNFEAAGNGDAVMRKDKTGAGSVSTLANNSQDNVDQSYSIALDDSYVYWSNSSTDEIRRTSKSSSPGNSTLIANSTDGISFPYGISLDTTYIYWASKGSDKIQRRSKDGIGTVTDIAITTDQVNAPRELVVKGQNVIWTNYGGNNVLSKAKDGSGSVVVVADNISDDVNAPYGITTDGSFIYWANSEDSINGNTIMRSCN